MAMPSASTTFALPRYRKLYYSDILEAAGCCVFDDQFANSSNSKPIDDGGDDDGAACG